MEYGKLPINILKHVSIFHYILTLFIRREVCDGGVKQIEDNVRVLKLPITSVRVVSELWRKLISLFDSLKARLVCVGKSHRKCG